MNTESHGNYNIINNTIFFLYNFIDKLYIGEKIKYILYCSAITVSIQLTQFHQRSIYLYTHIYKCIYVVLFQATSIILITLIFILGK